MNRAERRRLAKRSKRKLTDDISGVDFATKLINAALIMRLHDKYGWERSEIIGLMESINVMIDDLARGDLFTFSELIAQIYKEFGIKL